MQKGFRWIGRVAVPMAALIVGAGTASADCIRHVYNRSPLVLVGSQAGGPSFTIRPGTSRAIRLSGPGGLDLAGYCAPYGRGDGDPAAFGPPAVQTALRYTAVLDRCYMEIGHDFFDRELGRGFLPRRDTAPFTVNNPKQGDVVLYTDTAVCGSR
ncbi:hypothetical protein ASF60_12395 [Methylobacterium sp. Leaf113]|uniref:hypothetical protein n=1 Tax=Methylobacterium sp. Leaf113 TaxID=1736259 RepID=UPI0006FD5B89|nr:hypothetical protein [Methylobacterium sp. Leaf113]KQP94260.1 hypothetical protein ASF60_12395 [Methylobacterium sp. Leaf113]